MHDAMLATVEVLGVAVAAFLRHRDCRALIGDLRELREDFCKESSFVSGETGLRAEAEELRMEMRQAGAELNAVFARTLSTIADLNGRMRALHTRMDAVERRRSNDGAD